MKVKDMSDWPSFLALSNLVAGFMQETPTEPDESLYAVTPAVVDERGRLLNYMGDDAKTELVLEPQYWMLGALLASSLVSIFGFARHRNRKLRQDYDRLMEEVHREWGQLERVAMILARDTYTPDQLVAMLEHADPMEQMTFLVSRMEYTLRMMQRENVQPPDLPGWEQRVTANAIEWWKQSRLKRFNAIVEVLKNACGEDEWCFTRAVGNVAALVRHYREHLVNASLSDHVEPLNRARLSVQYVLAFMKHILKEFYENLPNAIKTPVALSVIRGTEAKVEAAAAGSVNVNVAVNQQLPAGPAAALAAPARALVAPARQWPPVVARR